MEELKQFLTVPILQNINGCKTISVEINNSKNKVQLIVNEIFKNPCLSNLYLLNDEYYHFYNLECNNYNSSKYLKILYDTYQNALIYVLYKVMDKVNNAIDNKTNNLEIFKYYNELIETSIYFSENYTKKNLEFIHNNIIYTLKKNGSKIQELIKKIKGSMTESVIFVIKKIIINLLTGYTGTIIKKKDVLNSLLIKKVRNIIYTYISTILNDFIFDFITSFSEFSFLRVLLEKNNFADAVSNIVLHHVFVLQGKIIQESNVKNIILEYDNNKIDNIHQLYVETRRLIFKYVCKVNYSCALLKSLSYMTNMILNNSKEKTQNQTYPYNYPRYFKEYEVLEGINYVFNALQYKYYCITFSDNINCYIRTFSEYKRDSDQHPTIFYESLNDDEYLFSLLKYYVAYSNNKNYIEQFKNSNIPISSKQLTYDELKNKINNNWSDFDPTFTLYEWSKEYYTVLNANEQMYGDEKYTIIDPIGYNSEKMPYDCKNAEIYVYKNYNVDHLEDISDPCIDFLYYNDRNNLITPELDTYLTNKAKIDFIQNGITKDNYSDYGLSLNTYNAIKRYFDLFNKYILTNCECNYGYLTKIQFKYWLKYFSGTELLNDVTMNCFNYITTNINKSNYPSLVYNIYSDFQRNTYYYILWSINHQDNFTSNLNLNNCFNEINPQYI